LPATKIFSQLQFLNAKIFVGEWHRSEAVGEFFLATTYTHFRQMGESRQLLSAWSGLDAPVN
jgi:hypothetical protein